jgi:hypothetical protein
LTGFLFIREIPYATLAPHVEVVTPTSLRNGVAVPDNIFVRRNLQFRRPEVYLLSFR